MFVVQYCTRMQADLRRWKPGRPMRPFQLFYRRELKRFRSENPGVSVSLEMKQQINQKWENVPQAEKERLQNEYEAKMVSHFEKYHSS